MRQDSLNGVFAVPPLARSLDPSRAIDFEQNARIIRHIAEGGISRFIYGGNAFLYHVTLEEYEQLLGWLAERQREGLWLIPSAGPSYGRLMDQAKLLRRFSLPCVMTLPCSDPRDAAGLERGLREFAEAASVRLMLYLKDEANMGADRMAGLDAVARLVDEGVCIAIKYAVVREHPEQDHYLEELLRRVDEHKVISGIGERPAIVHLRQWGLSGFTTGSGCLAPALSAGLHCACQVGDYAEAERLRSRFLPFEDLRDAWGPARVLHHGMELAGIVRTGPIPPYVSELSSEQQARLKPVAQELLTQQQEMVAGD
ncbi:MAG TPA: dihydrodipicolinate synthase family protein [Acidobacteriaceae bacterium]|nr:dihydrodipicolinate synthase family protein [Acidobacteriaceae bacterium]